MNFQPPTSGPQNGPCMQPLITSHTRLHMPENIATEFVPGLHNRKEFRYSKILKVKDMLLYLDRILYAFNNNHEIYNYLSDIIMAFKWQNSDTLSIANRLTDLLRAYPGIVEVYLASNTADYEKKGQPDESGYYFEVSVITNNSTETRIAALLQNHYMLIVSPPFIANSYIQPAEVLPRSYTLERLPVLESTPSPEPMHTSSQVSTKHTQTVGQIPHQVYVATNKGKKRQRIN